MKFVIIGGDAAGMSAASRAKRKMPDMEVIVLEKTKDVSYSACGMPYNISDPERNMDDLVVRNAEVFRNKQGIQLLTGHLAESIDRNAKKVSGRDDHGETFEYAYDKLLIATGGSPVVPDLSGFDRDGVLTLKSLSDGRKIKTYISGKKVRHAVIIGMGYIGLEMSEALCQRGIQVEMVKPGTVFLPWMANDLSGIVRDELIQKGVKLHTGFEIEKIETADDRLHLICKGLTIVTDMVISAIGISPNSAIAEESGLELGPGNSVSVNKMLQTSDENIYAAGDCADAFHVVTGQKTWVPLALRANRAGWAVADNVCGERVSLPGISGTAVFKVFDLEVARTGITEKEAISFGFEPVSVSIKSRSRAHAHPGSKNIWVHMTADKKTGRLIGTQMVGYEGVAHRINAVSVALHSHMTLEDFSQTDLAYAPPFGPVWDPLLTAANQLLKEL